MNPKQLEGALPGRRGRDLYRALRTAVLAAAWIAGKLPKPLLEWIFLHSRTGGGLFARALRFTLLRNLAVECGELVDVRESVHLLKPQSLSIGSRVSIHPMCYVDATGGLQIGDDVSIAHGVTIMTTEHSYRELALPIRDQEVLRRPVQIGSDVWIGAGARILAGVTIADGVVVAAGAVVTRDAMPRTVVAGVPARVIRERGQ